MKSGVGRAGQRFPDLSGVKITSPGEGSSRGMGIYDPAGMRCGQR